MTWLIIVAPFLVAGIAVIFIAFSGGPSAARNVYLTRGGRAVTALFVLLYVGLGIAVPALVITDRGEAAGATGSLRAQSLGPRMEEGKQLFESTCAACHNLDAVNAHGVQGPDLDELGALDEERVFNAIENGGTGQDLMPAQLLTGQEAEDVAAYVSSVAGR